MNTIRIFFCSMMVAVIVAVCWLFFSFWNWDPEFLRPVIEKMVERKFPDMDVEIDQLRVEKHLLRPMKVSLQNCRFFQEEKENKSILVVAEIRELSFPVSVWEVVRRRVNLNPLEIEGLKIQVSRDAYNQWNLEKLFSSRTKNSTWFFETLFANNLNQWIWDFVLQYFPFEKWQELSLWEIDRYDIQLRQSVISYTDEVLGVLNADSDILSWNIRSSHLNPGIQSELVARMTASDFSLALSYDKTKQSLDFDVNYGKGKLSFRGSLASVFNGNSLDASLAIRNMDVSDFYRLGPWIPPIPLKGHIQSADFELRHPGIGTADWSKTFVRGTAQMDTGEFLGINLGRDLIDKGMNRGTQHFSSNLKNSKWSGVLEGDHLPFKKLEIEGEFREGSLVWDRLWVTDEGYTVLSDGMLDLRRQWGDFRGKVGLEDELAKGLQQSSLNPSSRVENADEKTHFPFVYRGALKAFHS